MEIEVNQKFVSDNPKRFADITIIGKYKNYVWCIKPTGTPFQLTLNLMADLVKACRYKLQKP